MRRGIARVCTAQKIFAAYSQKQVNKIFLARLDDITERAVDDQCTGANPRYPLMSESKQIYLNAYCGK